MFKWLYKKKGCAKHMNNKLEVIGIDHGWSMMKTISQVFVTGVKEITTTPALFGDVLEYEGKFYKVGTVRQEVKDTKVEDDSFYLLTLAAVAKEAGGNQSNAGNGGQTTDSPKDNVSNPQPASVAYSPQNVVSLATAKCQAGGMITTQQNLQNHLNDGSITQEEYNEYYPYDGMEGSYYSVFVETDLNKASTIDGQRLSSEDAIAEYIASMLLLETDPVFYISYDGVYTTGGTDYYEFRCHR